MLNERQSGPNLRIKGTEYNVIESNAFTTHPTILTISGKYDAHEIGSKMNKSLKKNINITNYNENDILKALLTYKKVRIPDVTSQIPTMLCRTYI